MRRVFPRRDEALKLFDPAIPGRHLALLGKLMTTPDLLADYWQTTHPDRSAAG